MFINALVENGFNFCGAYHFAPPLAVDCTINDQLVTKYQAKVYDIVNGIDYVPRAGRNGVQHFGQFFRIGETGLLYKEKEAYIKFGLGDRRIKSEVAYHRIQNHIKAIRKPENDFRSINTRSAGKDYHEYIPTEKIEFCVEKK